MGVDLVGPVVELGEELGEGLGVELDVELDVEELERSVAHSMKVTLTPDPSALTPVWRRPLPNPVHF
jgi:hypothetical protein